MPSESIAIACCASAEMTENRFLSRMPAATGAGFSVSCHAPDDRTPSGSASRFLLAGILVVCCTGFTLGADSPAPVVIPARRSPQLADGFGMNIPLPREPRLPWTRRWWTRLADSGVKWVRIGQYENSSEKTSWDWVEQTPGRYGVSPDVDQAIRNLAGNGIQIEIELQYSNPLYQGDPKNRPRKVTLPPPGIGPDDEPPNPIFLPPRTEEQIQAFLRYVRFMVRRYKDLVKHWELWNEPNIAYWRPKTTTRDALEAKARDYGKLLARFADAVHQTDPEAKVIFGGLASPDLVFARAALQQCAAKIDIVAYHTYPGFGSNHMPEEMDDWSQLDGFRNHVRRIPGIRKDIVFWINEWNVSPGWKNCNESVQARYLPRFFLYTHAQGVRGFLWTFVPGTDGNEGDLFGLLHGETFAANAFQPRQAYRAFEATSALFSQTVPDPTLPFELQSDSRDVPALRHYALRDRKSGKPIDAFWLAVPCDEADHFHSVPADLVVHDLSIRKPVLIDVRTGAVETLSWKDKGVLRVPLKDSVMAVADASFLDWPNLPETPGPLSAARIGSEVRLRWQSYARAARTQIDKSVDQGPWETLAQMPGTGSEFIDRSPGKGLVSYRVRTVGESGPSAWSNPAWVDVRH
jgi:hypothetical protein